MYLDHATINARLTGLKAAPPTLCDVDTLAKDFVKAILDTLVLYIIPLVNPDGREYSLTAGNAMWRKNRTAGGGGVDINRNFDIPGTSSCITRLTAA